VDWTSATIPTLSVTKTSASAESGIDRKIPLAVRHSHHTATYCGSMYTYAVVVLCSLMPCFHRHVSVAVSVYVAST